MGRPILINGLWSTLAVCLLVVSCLTVVDCGKLSKLASNTDRHDILTRSRRDEGCDGSRCLNGGVCIHFAGYEFCVCPSTHSGRYCEFENPCNDSPCQNGGICLPDVTSLRPDTFCLCQEGWSGLNCEIGGTPSSCSTYTCRNGGTCYTYEDFPLCDCAPGFSGDECDHIDPCSTVQCPESHDCVAILGVVHCVCVAGVTGPDCMIDTDDNNDCADNDPCLNGGTCDDTAEPGFKVCRCPSGYDGLYCEMAITSSMPCNNQHTPCANGGTCETYGDNYYCHCTTEYFGANCTESIYYPFCLDYCENGGSCYIDESDPHCACTPSWEGRRCSTPKHHTVTEAPVPDCTLQCGDYGECRLKTSGDQYCRCNSGWNGDRCQNKEVIAPDTPATTGSSIATEDRAPDTPANTGSSIGAVLGGSIGGVLLLFIVLMVIAVMVSVSRATNRRRQQSHSHAVGYSNSAVYDPRFGNENGGFVHAQATPNPSSLPAKDLYGSNHANGSNMPRRYTKNQVQNNYTVKEPSVARNPASAYQYAYGAPPPARKTSRSSVPPESHEYAYATGDYQPLRPPTATGPPPPYSGAPSISGSVAPSVAASAEHTYQSLSEFGDNGRSIKH